MQVNKRRQQSLAFRWIIDACREAGGRPMADRLADELMAAFRKEGKAMNTREQHPPHGRCEQGVRPLRVVSSRFHENLLKQSKKAAGSGRNPAAVSFGRRVRIVRQVEL